MSTPRVSVVLPVYNASAFVEASINSILGQTVRDLEVIVINDGSTDSTPSIVEKMADRDERLRIIHQENQGIGRSLAKGFDVAAGEFIARQDADDVSAPTRLRAQLRLLETNIQMGMCGTWTIGLTPRGEPSFRYEPPNDDAELRRLLQAGSNPFVHGSVMVRKAAYRSAPWGYRFQQVCEDLDLWLQIAQVGEVGIACSHEYAYLDNQNGISARTRDMRKPLTRLCVQLARERESNGFETTNWNSAVAEIEAGIPNSTEKEATAHQAYALAIDDLLRGRYSSYIRHLFQALRLMGTPNFAIAFHLIMIPFAILTRRLYIRKRSRRKEFYEHIADPTTASANLDWLPVRVVDEAVA